jgi:hypothetical protein
VSTTTALPAALQTLANDYVREELWADEDTLFVADFCRDYLDCSLSDVDTAGVARIVRALGEAYETVSECPECWGQGVVELQLGNRYAPRSRCDACEECGGRGRMHERPAFVLSREALEATALPVAAE